MPLIPWRPFNLDRFFDEDLIPLPKISLAESAMDVYETEKEVVAEVNAPGFNPDKIEVSVSNGVLRVKGKIEEKKEEKKKNYWRKEIRHESFERMTRLPTAVAENKVKASYEKGVLKIVMPKTEKGKPKEKKVKIEVKKP